MLKKTKKMRTQKNETAAVMGFIAEVIKKQPKPFNEQNICITVRNASMSPKYIEGDILACKTLSLDDLFFQWGRTYIFQTEQGDFVRKVLQGQDKDHILLVAENPQFEPFELHISQIITVALSIGVLRLE